MKGNGAVYGVSWKGGMRKRGDRGTVSARRVEGPEKGDVPIHRGEGTAYKIGEIRHMETHVLSGGRRSLVRSVTGRDGLMGSYGAKNLAAFP